MSHQEQLKRALLRSEGLLCQGCDQLLADEDRKDGYCKRCWEKELQEVMEIAHFDDPEPRRAYDSSGWWFYPELEPDKQAYSFHDIYGDPEEGSLCE